jgi:hypothetical protein
MYPADIGWRCGEAEFRDRACHQIRRKDVLMMGGNAIRGRSWWILMHAG